MDASDNSIASSSMLAQQIYDDLVPLSCFSSTLNSAQSNHSITERELLTIVHSLQKYRHVIVWCPIKIYSDNKALNSLLFSK